MKGIFFSFIFVLSYVNAFKNVGQNVKVFNENTLDLPVTSTHAKLVEFEEGYDTLFINRSSESFPISYVRKIATGVCLNSECRPLYINIHWTVTGRFLGFELPDGEFLSKTDHEKFNEIEYQEMNKMVSNPNSILANFSINDLTEPVPEDDIDNEKVDAISAATRSSILEYCVEGAVYTTYTLWHIIYGETRSKVIEMTESTLSPELLSIIMDSQNLSDKKWGLIHAGKYRESPKIQKRIFSIIESQDMELVDMAINVFSASCLESDSLQLKLFSYYPQSDDVIKRKILKKLQLQSHLNENVKKYLIENLGDEDKLIEDVLDILFAYDIQDKVLLRKIARLLTHHNVMVAYKTYTYLTGQNVNDHEIRKLVGQYLRKNE